MNIDLLSFLYLKILFIRLPAVAQWHITRGILVDWNKSRGFQSSSDMWFKLMLCGSRVVRSHMFLCVSQFRGSKPTVYVAGLSSVKKSMERTARRCFLGRKFLLGRPARGLAVRSIDFLGNGRRERFEAHLAAD